MSYIYCQYVNNVNKDRLKEGIYIYWIDSIDTLTLRLILTH